MDSQVTPEPLDANPFFQSKAHRITAAHTLVEAFGAGLERSTYRSHGAFSERSNATKRKYESQYGSQEPTLDQGKATVNETRTAKARKNARAQTILIPDEALRMATKRVRESERERAFVRYFFGVNTIRESSFSLV